LKTTLKNITNIQTGVFAKPISEGEIIYLQSKHFNEEGLLNATLHPDLKSDGISDKHLLQPGDVLFSAKGTKNFATCFETTNQPAVASTSFFVIRMQEEFRDKVIPEYLTWFINQPFSQTYLKGKAIGTSIVSISKTVLEELEISIPEIKTQQTILKIFHLYNKEKSLKKQIATLREKQIQQQIIQAIK
jgi:restriction endonuclease S subunit